MKKIAIDCRYLGMSGIGRFLEGILNNFDFNLFDITLIGKKEKITKYKNVKYIYDDSNPFSKKSILNWNKVKQINKNDCFYSPNFIIPFGIKIICYTTLHDIIFLDLKEVNKNKIDYISKKFLLKRCMKKSKRVFTVSKFSKDRIAYHFKKYIDKIVWSYPGVSHNFVSYSKNFKKENYIIYVGNIKKNKGLKTLLNAIPYINQNIEIKIVGDATNFKNGDFEIIKLFDNPRITFTGKISDDELLDLIAKAKYLIQPSLYEGFGLPPLEALYLGTQPIISNIEVFKEVYNDLPVKFFEVLNSNDLANKINEPNDIISIDKDRIEKEFSHKKCVKIIVDMLKY